MFFYGYDRSMSMGRTFALFAIAIAMFTAMALFINPVSGILAGMLWFTLRLFSPNIMERAVAFFLLSIAASAVTLFYR